MNRRIGTLCTALVVVLLSLPAAAQGKTKTRVLRDSSNHTTIVIHDYSPQAYARQRDIAVRAEQAKEAELQRQHELELAKIQADAQVRAARAQQMVTQTPAAPPAYVKPEEKKPSYRNGGYFTGFSPVYIGGYGGYGYGGFGYGGGGGFFPGYGYAGNCRPSYNRCAPVRCAPAYRGCR